MAISFQAKDTQVLSAQLKAQSVIFKADLEAGTTQEASFASVSGAAGATCSVDVDVKEDIEKVIRAVVFNNKTGSVVAQTAAPSFSGSVVTIADIDASTPDLSDVSIELHYEVK